MADGAASVTWNGEFGGAGGRAGAPPPPLDAPPPAAAAQHVVTIEPGHLWRGLDVRELWTYRELLYFLTWRDLKVRYKQTALGVAWVLLLPLVTALIYTIFIGRVAHVSSDGVPYPLFAYAGLLPWTLFASAVSTGAYSITGSTHLITKVYFPRAIVPAAAVAARVVDFAISGVFAVVLMAVYRVGFGWHLLFLPVLLAVVIAFSLGVALWLAALNVRYRDVGMIVGVALQLWMFASPVVYPVSLVPARWRLAYGLNPMAGIITNFRAALYGAPFDWPSLGVSVLVTAVVLALAAREFSRLERSFADFI